jgi:hypothetical protein
MTFRNGGIPANHLGESTEGYFMGSELDWAIGFGGEKKRWGPFNPSFQVEGGHLWLSQAVGADEDSLFMMMATGWLRW